jgi:tetrapyrrole methylase family protein / MazG family protein
VIRIVGLGPGDPGLLTRAAWDALSTAGLVHLRTRKHPTVKGLPAGLKLRSFDTLYQRANAFDDIYAEIARRIVRAARQHRNVTYAVPGHPLVGERSVPLILDHARMAGIPVEIIGGVSFVEPVLEALAIFDSRTHPLATGWLLAPDALDGVQLCDALDLARAHHPALNPDKPAIIAQPYARRVVSDVKLTLMNQYAPDHLVVVLQAGRVDRLLPLAELDHSDAFDHLTSLYLPPAREICGLEGLQETVAHLRAPEGCPWDREQTHQSLRNTLLEEAFEVLTALDENDMPALKEEMGDLLLNIVLQAQIATEAEEFRMSDVIAGIDAKLKRRHPHVFGDAAVDGAAQVVANWNEIKKAEKAAKGQTEFSALDGISPALPALAQAQKIAHRADRAGFRWSDTSKRFDKVMEELREVRTAKGQVHRQEEFGDLIFTIAYWADSYGIDIETAAREANQKFSRRYRALEALVRSRNQNMQTMTEAALLSGWREIKAHEKRARRTTP